CCGSVLAPRAVMNYIFGNNTLYPRGGRANTASGHAAPGSKQRHEELPSSSSRWQQLLAFFTRRGAFSDCITAGASQVTLATAHLLHGMRMYLSQV
ncbi:hypothetical protein M9458_013807, partial [Cirrhinus mrigala]